MQLKGLFLIAVFAKNFRVSAVMKTSALLSWEVPDSYKSAVPFKVRADCPGCPGAPVAGEQRSEQQPLYPLPTGRQSKVPLLAISGMVRAQQ